MSDTYEKNAATFGDDALGEFSILPGDDFFDIPSPSFPSVDFFGVSRSPDPDEEPQTSKVNIFCDGFPSSTSRAFLLSRNNEIYDFIFDTSPPVNEEPVNTISKNSE
jgi:hypothetical protein